MKISDKYPSVHYKGKEKGDARTKWRAGVGTISHGFRTGLMWNRQNPWVQNTYTESFDRAGLKIPSQKRESVSLIYKIRVLLNGFHLCIQIIHALWHGFVNHRNMAWELSLDYTGFGLSFHSYYTHGYSTKKILVWVLKKTTFWLRNFPSYSQM